MITTQCVWKNNETNKLVFACHWTSSDSRWDVMDEVGRTKPRAIFSTKQNGTKERERESNERATRAT